MFITDLDPNVPMDTESRSSGYVRLRNIKSAIKNTFPNIDSPVLSTAEEIDASVSSGGWTIGMITPFNGSSLPPGWAFCNGDVANGFKTPDLRNLFIKGASADGDMVPNNLPDSISLLGYTEIQNFALEEKHLPRHRHRVGTWGMNEGSGFPRNYPYREPGTAGSTARKGITRSTGGLSGMPGSTKGHTHGIREYKTMSTSPDFYVLSFIVYVGG